jgi:hypothetical protein
MVTEAARRRKRVYLASLIDKIFDADPRIRSVSIYQDRYIIAGGMRSDRESFDSEEEAHDIDLQLAKIGEITHSWQKWFGTMDVLAVKYQKVNLLFQPLSEGRFLVLSTDIELNPFVLMEKLKKEDYGHLAELIP